MFPRFRIIASGIYSIALLLVKLLRFQAEKELKTVDLNEILLFCDDTESFIETGIEALEKLI